MWPFYFIEISNSEEFYANQNYEKWVSRNSGGRKIYRTSRGSATQAAESCIKNRCQYRDEMRRGEWVTTLPPGQRADVPASSSWGPHLASGAILQFLFFPRIRICPFTETLLFPEAKFLVVIKDLQHTKHISFARKCNSEWTKQISLFTLWGKETNITEIISIK